MARLDTRLMAFVAGAAVALIAVLVVEPLLGSEPRPAPPAIEVGAPSGNAAGVETRKERAKRRARGRAGDADPNDGGQQPEIGTQGDPQSGGPANPGFTPAPRPKPRPEPAGSPPPSPAPVPDEDDDEGGDDDDTDDSDD